MAVKFQWAYCWLDQPAKAREMKAPWKWTISVLSAHGHGCWVSGWGCQGNSREKILVFSWNENLIKWLSWCIFKTIKGRFLCYAETPGTFEAPFRLTPTPTPGRNKPKNLYMQLIYAFNNCASLPLQSGRTHSLISCRSVVLEWWHFQWAGTPWRPCIQLRVPRSRKGNAEIHQDQLRYQLSARFPSPPSACVPAPGSFKSHLIWSLWGFN